MARIVRAALLQAEWTGDKDSMIEKHIRYAREAANQGAKVMCFQELFYGPYFCQVQDPQYYSYTEKIPDGPTTKRMQELAKETGMVLVVPMYEEDEHTSGIYYNTAAVIDADGSYLGKYRKTHIPHVKGFWEKFYFRPGNLGYPVFETAVGKVGVYICYDRHFPEGARMLGLHGAELVLYLFPGRDQLIDSLFPGFLDVGVFEFLVDGPEDRLGLAQVLHGLIECRETRSSSAAHG